ADVAKVRKLFDFFNTKVKAGDYEGAIPLLAPNPKMTGKVTILGGKEEDISTIKAFTEFFKKNSFGGTLKLTLTKIIPRSTSPYKVDLLGTLILSTGPLPNTPIDFISNWTFIGNLPEMGQLKNVIIDVVGVHSGDSSAGGSTSNSTTSNPTTSNSTTSNPTTSNPTTSNPTDTKATASTNNSTDAPTSSSVNMDSSTFLSVNEKCYSVFFLNPIRVLIFSIGSYRNFCQ
ncbi:hypothetical protein CROQUDRAFT_39180, partial [Cronartium quercuum f. sp. fusiforme G11]